MILTFSFSKSNQASHQEDRRPQEGRPQEGLQEVPRQEGRRQEGYQEARCQEGRRQEVSIPHSE